MINKIMYLLGCLKGKKDDTDVDQYIKDLKEIMDDLGENYVIVKKNTRNRKKGASVPMKGAQD